MITHDRWQRIKEIFQAAQEKTAAERTDFLDRICGDDTSIREEVEALLTADASNDSDHFLDTPAFELGAELIAGDTNETIEFASGQKIGRYTILSPLGEGGMGQIYLAQDDQLGRKVALKFIAREFATNPRRVVRFEQEAIAVSSLNHPNVCVIHETGVTENNRHFIAMEYIEGVTLRDKLARETVTPLEAVHIAVQVAAALASAHAAGIIHRDIKPENIMVRPDGYVKVLDFGLAKLTERVPQRQQISKNVRTEAGTLMGTVKYMSPEQLREFELDGRTDVWSLGVVLYEMLAGRTPFESRIPNDSIVMILGPQTPALPLPPHVPARFHEIISKAIEKDRDKRYQTVHKLAADLNALQKELERQNDDGVASGDVPSIGWYPPVINGEKTHQLTAGSAIFTRLKSQALTTADFLFSEIKTHRTAAALFTGVTGVLVVLLLIPGISRYFNPFTPPPVEQQPAFKPKLAPFTNSGTSLFATFSPDGTLIAHVDEDMGKQRVMVSNSDTTLGTAVVPAEEVRYLGLTFSRDNYLYLTRKEKNGDRILYRLPYPVAEGVKPVALATRDIDSPIGLSPQGDQFAFVRFNHALNQFSLVVADIDGGNERTLITRQDGNTLSTYGLSWLPDGTTIVCSQGFWKQGFHMGLIAVDAKTGSERVLGNKDWFWVSQVAWQPETNALLVSAREGETTPYQIWRVTFPEGRVESITSDLNEYMGVSIAGEKIVTVRTERSWRLSVTRLSGRQPSVQIGKGGGFTWGMAWSKKGYLVHSSMVQSRMDITRVNPDGSNSIRLTNSGINYNPALSADGRFVVFSTDLDGRFNIWRMNAHDGSDAKQLTFTDGNYYPSISPDGKWVVYDNLSNWKVSSWKVPFEGGEPVKIFDGYRMPVVSPDGRRIAARYEEDSGTNDVAIFSIDGGEALQHVPIPVLEWQRVQWLNDHTLSYIDSVKGTANLWSYDLRTGDKKQLTFFEGDPIVAYAWSPDFKHVAVQHVTNIGDVTIISSER